jgi:hypothetical protein
VDEHESARLAAPRALSEERVFVEVGWHRPPASADQTSNTSLPAPVDMQPHQA